MLKRKIYNQLLDWKTQDKGSCALLIAGARRVGKSFVAEQFAKSEYKSHILINFSNAPEEIKDIFSNESSNLDMFFAKLSAFYRVKLFERNTIFIFDEVQQFPRARELIKFLVADGRYDYLETGSLITLRKNVENIVIPSEEEQIEMFPLDFEEFLWAFGDETTVPLLQECFKKQMPLGQALHRKTMNLFREYMLVGGMPQSVIAYQENKDFSASDRIKRRILKLYRDDVTKFAGHQTSKVLSIFDGIPSQLSQKEKKYNLSSLGKNARLRAYEDAFIWLREAMVVNTCFNATEPTVGLNLNTERTTQKCYMADTGLLVTHTFSDDNFSDNELYRDILLDKLNVNEGMIAENVVAQELRSHGHKLFFFSRSDSSERTNNIEIDFLLRSKRKICPVEVKSASYQHHASLDKFYNKYSDTLGQAYILYTKDIMKKNNILHLPLYMAMFL